MANEMAQSFDPTKLYPRTTELDDEREINVYQSEIGDVGCVVWDAAIVLAKFYEHISSTTVNKEGHEENTDRLPLADLEELVKRCNKQAGKVLELGSGTGYAGIVAACMGAQVTITDLPEFVDLMNYNIQKNCVQIKELGGSCQASQLVWGTTTPTQMSREEKVDLILLADCIYYKESLKPLVETMVSLSSADTLIVCCHEHRTTDNKPLLQKLFFEEISKHFSIFKVPTMHQHPTYSSDDIHINLFKPLDSTI